jgi:WD40 repeat protein
MGTSQLARPITWPCAADRTCENVVVFSPNGKYAAGADDNEAYVWRLPSGTLATKVSDPVGYNVGPLDISADGKILVLGDSDGGPDVDVTFFPATYVYKIP